MDFYTFQKLNMTYNASVELNNTILKFITYEKNHNEQFYEIKKLLFTKEKINKYYSIIDIFNLTIMYQKIKNSAINKLLNQEPLTFFEGFLIERLLMTFHNQYIPIEIHLKILLKKIKFNNDN